jgi:phosphoglucomutase
MANVYKHQGKSLYDRLQELYAKFGDFKTVTLAYEFQGLEGKAHIKQLMVDFRGEGIKKILGNVDHVGDYLEQKIHFKDHDEPTNLPKSNVVKFFLANGETITIRPSGTEPKLKAYVFALGEDSLAKLKQKVDDLTAENLELKHQLRSAKEREEILKSSDKEITNVDILRRLSQLEKIIYGKEDK